MTRRIPEGSNPSAGLTSSRTLHMLTCGSAGSGKSTLLGRLVLEAGGAPDRSGSMQSLGAGAGETGGHPARLFDGLLDEAAHFGAAAVTRLQTARRRFIVADAPGHEQYTRNLVMDASQCELALLLVDAQRGITSQTRRHTAIVHLTGIEKVVVAINKADLANWDEGTFLRLRDEFLQFARPLGVREPAFIPVCALHGDNVVQHSARMPWYRGPSLVECLDAVAPAIEAIVSSGDSTPAMTDRLEANIVWMGEEPLLPGRRYELRAGATTVTAAVKRLIHRLNLETLASESATRLGENDIGRCEVMTERPIACDLYSTSRARGSFILVDRLSSTALAAGMVTANQARQVFWQSVSVDKAARAAAKGQHPRVVWFTGLSGAGKSTLASAVEQALFREGRHTYLIDGDNIRHGLSKDLGFGSEDRIENTRRAGELAKLMADAGLIVLVSLISPFRAERSMVRELLQPGEFVEVYVATPLEICESRDRKGLYRLAREGKLKEFTGISSPYEPPEAAEIVVDTSSEPLEHCVRRVVEILHGG